MTNEQSDPDDAAVAFARRQGINDKQARLRLVETGAQGVVEATVEPSAEDSDPPDLRADAKRELTSVDATPGTGILPDPDDDDPNMQPSG